MSICHQHTGCLKKVGAANYQFYEWYNISIRYFRRWYIQLSSRCFKLVRQIIHKRNDGSNRTWMIKYACVNCVENDHHPNPIWSIKLLVLITSVAFDIWSWNFTHTTRLKLYLLCLEVLNCCGWLGDHSENINYLLHHTFFWDSWYMHAILNCNLLYNMHGVYTKNLVVSTIHLKQHFYMCNANTLMLSESSLCQIHKIWSREPRLDTIFNQPRGENWEYLGFASNAFGSNQSSVCIFDASWSNTRTAFKDKWRRVGLHVDFRKDLNTPNFAP